MSITLLQAKEFIILFNTYTTAKKVGHKLDIGNTYRSWFDLCLRILPLRDFHQLLGNITCWKEIGDKGNKVLWKKAHRDVLLIFLVYLLFSESAIQSYLARSSET